jgi:GntR family transcriptional regulator, N-acetylglucosamine utilization regulator
MDRPPLPNRLPHGVSSFVGRERERAEVASVLARGRLLTLTGPGRAGKTRLALRVAADMASALLHGTWLAELAPLTDPTLVTNRQVADALVVTEKPPPTTCSVCWTNSTCIRARNSPRGHPSSAWTSRQMADGGPRTVRTIYTRADVTRAELDARVLAARLRPAGDSPLHSQVENGLRRLIQSGEVAPGSALPGELKLAAELGISRHTIRHALNALAGEGLLRRERGRGTLVMPAQTNAVTERSLTSFYAFAWELSARGVEQRSFVLERTTLVAPRAVAQRLGSGSRARVERIVRLRTASGEPLVLETAYLPAELASGLDAEVLERGSVYDALEQHHGLRVTRAHETIRPVVLTRTLARMLGVKAGSAAFRVERTTWSDRGPVEWQESVLRGDRYLYSVDLPRQGRLASGV